MPGYVQNLDQLKAKKVDEVWCVSVNDGFVMAAWGQQEKAIGKVRMLGDGNGDFAKKLGLDQDLTKGGMGLRMQRFSMLVAFVLFWPEAAVAMPDMAEFG